MNKAAVVIFTYRKDYVLHEVFQAINKYNPPRLYIVCNAPANEGESEMVNTVRKAIAAFNFTTPPQLLLAEHHRPGREIFNFGLQPVFRKEEQVIVLEDDTVPTLSFFDFCNYFLEKYSADESIGCISGCNLNAVQQPELYFKSDYCLPCWGWATWRRAWNYYREDCSLWAENRALVSATLLKQDDYFIKILDRYSKRLISWDIQWNLALWATGKKNLVPGVNLVTNKGFGHKSTFTQKQNSAFGQLPAFNCEADKMELRSDSELEKAQYLKIKELFTEIGEAGL